MPLGYNRVLGDLAKSPESRPHQVALANWPATLDDPRSETFERLVNHVAASGYDGVELGLEKIGEKHFAGDTLPVVARKARRHLEAANLQMFGSTLHLQDSELRAIHRRDDTIDRMKLVQDAGGAYVSIQFFLHEDYVDTGGAYRDDEVYLQWCAGRVAEMRDAAWDLGLNFYLEVHAGRVTEDPAACYRILQLATCEINGDMSHYLARSFLRGPHVQTILKHMGHTHVRLARILGDLSAAVEDPKADWQQEGLTWQMFKFMQPGLAGGLSSRVIVGETGRMHLVEDALSQDAALVPLYRAMARYADASAQGIKIAVDSPQDLLPWG